MQNKNSFSRVILATLYVYICKICIFPPFIIICRIPATLRTINHANLSSNTDMSLDSIGVHGI